ncbi:MAG: type II toxin-antitoxin system VapC family toxin [Novosphingobium sp.]
MKYLLDANIIIRLLIDDIPALTARVAECDAGSLATSAIAFGEVALGTELGKLPPKAALDGMLEEVTLLPFDEAAARTYARLPFKRASYDRLIAAHALSRGLVLVTDNQKHFTDVPGLMVENWAV